MPIKEYGSVTGVASFLQVVGQVRSDWSPKEPPQRRGDEERLWFRGQHLARWGLSPKLYRELYKGSQENEIRQEFESRAKQLVQGRLPETKWEWYFHMQHYGIPTRLLDWTENPLAALYFAVDGHPGRCDAAVWVLDPWWLNKKLKLGINGPMLPGWVEAELYLPDLEDGFAGKEPTSRPPAAIDPPHVDRRLAAQESRFVIFGVTQDLTRTKAVRGKGCRLAKILIPPSKAAGIQRELEECGTTISALFPDLEGLSKEICRKWIKR